MFMPLVLCDQLECVVENCDWIIYFFIILFAVYCFLYRMCLPIWRIKLYIYVCYRKNNVRYAYLKMQLLSWKLRVFYSGRWRSVAPWPVHLV